MFVIFVANAIGTTFDMFAGIYLIVLSIILFIINHIKCNKVKSWTVYLLQVFLSFICIQTGKLLIIQNIISQCDITNIHKYLQACVIILVPTLAV